MTQLCSQELTRPPALDPNVNEARPMNDLASNQEILPSGMYKAMLVRKIKIVFESVIH